jgi:cytosine/adenosine deaminase-related metal-dependent hydrolase
MSKSAILLKGGVVLTHGLNDEVIPLKADVLIENNIIAAIGPDVKGPVDATIIDCTDKIISPGFVDTHHHVWQSLLKGRHANDSLLDYMLSGLLPSFDKPIRRPLTINR